MREDVVGQTGAKDLLLSRVERLIGRQMQEAEGIFLRELQSRHPYVSDVLNHMNTYRGKRLRPMLLLLSAGAVGEIEQAHTVLAAVVEMIHTATLVHDDVLDEADIRRHVSTVNSRYNNETSVLLGDYLFTHAFHLASSLESTLACRWIGRATNLVCEGELCQIHERGNLDLSEEQYIEIIEGKTAELCAICCALGSHFAGGAEQITKAFDNYGRSLGIAFQIADDLLDVWGDESQTGKTLGSDFEKQKLTLPVIHLLATSTPQDAVRIRELLQTPSAQSRNELQRLLGQSSAVEYSRRRAQEFAAAARAQLTCVPETPYRQFLEELTEFALQRSS